MSGDAVKSDWYNVNRQLESTTEAKGAIKCLDKSIEPNVIKRLA